MLTPGRRVTACFPIPRHAEARHRRLAARSTAIALFIVLAMGSHGRAQTSTGPATEAQAAAQQFDEQAEEYRRRAQDCLPLLSMALNAEYEMNGLIAAGKSNRPEFQSKNIERAEQLRKFGACVIAANRNVAPTQAAPPPPPASDLQPVSGDLGRARSDLQGAVDEQAAIGGPADEFVGGLQDWARQSLDGAAGTIQFLSQPPGAPAQQILDYLTHDVDAGAIAKTLRGDAERAVRLLQQNPARFWGRTVPNLVPLAGPQLVARAARLSQAARRVTAMTRALNRFRGATRATNLRSGVRFAPPPPGAVPQVLRQVTTPSGAVPINPCGLDNVCFPAHMAAALRRMTGRAFTVQSRGKLLGSGGVRNKDIEAFLKQAFGDNPRAISPYGGEAGEIWAEGIPIPIRGEAEIAAELKEAGSEGLVFINYDGVKVDPLTGRVILDPKTGLPEVARTGHVVGAHNGPEGLVIRDELHNGDGRMWFTMPNASLFFYRLVNPYGPVR